MPERLFGPADFIAHSILKKNCQIYPTAFLFEATFAKIQLCEQGIFMANEAWLNGKLEGFAPIVMPAAHALRQAMTDLENTAKDLTDEELTARPNNVSSVAFHLRHIAGSVDRLLTYADGKELNEAQFDFLKLETDQTSNLTAEELIEKAIEKISRALEILKTTAPETLFEERLVGRQKLSTTVFGLLFHIAEHTARHVGQIITTAKIVRKLN